MELVPPIMEALKQQGAEDMLVILGGIIPEEDRPQLQQMGVAGVFGPGTSTQDIAEFIRKEVRKRREKQPA